MPGRNHWELFPVALILLTGTSALSASNSAPQIGGGNCSTSMVNGTYFYILAGAVSSGGENFPYAELGELVADGSGGVSGKSFTNLNGNAATNSLAGTYSVQSNCAGTITLAVNSQAKASIALTFQVINNAQAMLIAVSSAGGVVTGRAYRTTAGSSAPQCGNGSLSGTYGYVLTGTEFVAGRSFAYSESGKVE